MSVERWEIVVTGTVQGVGFRPFVHNLAVRYGLAGWVLNAPQGVRIEVQGSPAGLEGFLRALREEAPPHALLVSIFSRPIPVDPAAGEGFAIIDSQRTGPAAAAVPPDLASCPDCLAEVSNPGDRRFRYPFANCTKCGPRFTIVTALPYDRPFTSMKDFAMCAACAAEYHNPADRRFHAQPVACPACGPALKLLVPDKATGRLKSIPSPDPLAEAGAALRAGKVVAVKGLGGFHLACDAANDAAVARIREIKARAAKPFAVMCRDLNQVRELCQVTAEEEECLTSDRRPIVIMFRRQEAKGRISPGVAPGQDTLGVMLPYTPLHYLLLEDMTRPLVMTSGNVSDEPIAKDESELAENVIAGLDLVVTHDRRIVSRCDDSVVVASPNPILIRRSRGFVPTPVPVLLKQESLGVGADLKNTACFIRDGLAYPTQHIGDVEEESSFETFLQTIEHFRELFGFRPEIVGCDLHPLYTSRKAAYSMGLPVVEVQHHHAHIAACLAENNRSEKVIGVAFDGTGYGSDGTVWGGEFLIADCLDFTREASLRPVPMPGGEKAAREPWRMAVACLWDAFEEDWPDFPGAENLYACGLDLLLPALKSGVNSPLASSAGRLFDAVAALLGLCLINSFEGEAAMRLEAAARRGSAPSPVYRFEPTAEDNLTRLDFRPAIRGLTADLKRGIPVPDLALGFHLAVANGILDICMELRNETGLSVVALSGGVFQNRLLLAEAIRLLETAGFTVLRHRSVPPNDGGVSLGQAAVASESLMRK